MLFIFRQLRRLELRQRSGRYFLYAIGEIVLIVVGILIALQIQNWNEKRLDRIAERDILQRIADEVEGNIRMITFRLSQMEGKAEALDRLAENFSTQSYDNAKDFLLDVITGSWFAWTHPEIQVFVFEEFQSSGNFGLVRNKELLNRIMAFYNANAGFSDRADYRRSDMLNIVADLVPFDDGRAHVLEAGLTQNQYEEIAQRVLQSDLHLQLLREQNHEEFLSSHWETFIERAEDLLTDIKAELNR